MSSCQRVYMSMKREKKKLARITLYTQTNNYTSLFLYATKHITYQQINYLYYKYNDISTNQLPLL